MKKNAFIKAILRQPFRSLLMLLLIGAITYGITSHVVEYLAVLNVTKQLEKYYRPIGKLDSENYDVTRGRELVSESPYVGFEDERRCCSGVLEDLYNADIHGRYKYGIESYVSDVIFYGVLQDKKYVEVTDRDNTYGKKIPNKVGEYQFIFKVNKVEAGYPDYLTVGNPIYVSFRPEAEDELKVEFDALEIGEQYLVRAYYSEMLDSKNNPGQIESGKAGQWFMLNKLTGDNLYFYPIDEGAAVDYSDVKLSGLKELMEVVNENQRSMMVIGTKDMSLMPDVQESSRRYYIVDGRRLNREDDLDKKKLCVIHSFFAQRRGLSVGDKITLKLRNMDGQGHGYILLPEAWNNWKSYETVEMEFEIAGIYDEVFPPGRLLLTYHTNRLFIPDSCMPEEFVPEMLEVTNSFFYSFVLKSAEDQEAFLAENRNTLESMGITVSFIDNNADNFGISSRRLKKSNLMSAWIFAAAFLPTLGLIVLIYLSQRRREFAIARAMGIPKNAAFYQVGAAAVWIGLPGIAIGGTAAWYITVEKAKNMLKEFAAPEGAEHNSLLPVYWLLLIISGIFFIFLVSIIIGTSYIAKQPVLELLQGQAGRRDKGKKNDRNAAPQAGSVRDKDGMPDGTGLLWHSDRKPIIVPIEEIIRSGKYKVSASVRYIYHHMTRSYGKSIFMLMITVAFITAFGWLYWTIQQNMEEVERLYNSTVIDGEIFQNHLVNIDKGGGVIQPRVVDKLNDSGFIKESYLEETALVNSMFGVHPDGTLNNDVTFQDMVILSFNNLERFLDGTGEGITIEFMQGYDVKTFLQDDGEVPEVIIPRTSIEGLGEQLGDIICLRVEEVYTNCRIVGSYQGDLPSVMKNPIIMSEYQMRELVNDDFNYLIAKFTFDPSKNKELLQKEKELEDMVSVSNGAIKLRLMIWDEELHQVIEPMERNLSFLKIIYPVAVVVFSLIGTALSFLMILLRAKEAATMRVLGSPKSKVRILFAAEQVAVCLIGSIFGTILIVILLGVVSTSTQRNITLYFIGCIIGAVFGSVFVTNKVPLELLQTKE
jgi:ABC-type antimicrobial peptide transport system permease subunit